MKKFELHGNAASLIFHEGTGEYRIATSSFLLAGCKPLLRLNGKEVSFGHWSVTEHTKNSMVASAKGNAGNWTLKFGFAAGDALTLRLSGCLKKVCDDVELLYFDGLKMKADHLLSQGIKMGGCAAIPLDKGTKKDFYGAMQLLVTEKGEQLRLSYPLRCEFMPFFSGRAVSGGICDFKTGAVIKHYSQKKFALEPLTLRTGDGFALMKEYAAENMTEKRDFSELAAPGWNSWDYYRWTITEDEVLENAEFIAADPVLSKHVKKIIVDDGWQYAYGEWEANSLFPHGMKYLADRITKLGFEPGLWVAPVIVEPHARIAQLDPDMLAKAENGLPTLCWSCMQRHGFILDPTVERSQKFIRDTFERLVSYGYRHFKLDFLGGVLNARQFTDKSVTRGRLMDLTIGTARRAVAGRARLLGCNYLFCGGSEPVDSVRVGGDIHAKWKSIQGNTPSIAARFWSNKTLWLNDPDFALCRGFDTANDPDLNRLLPCLVYIPPESTEKNHPGLFTLVDVYRPQAEILLSLVIAAGGAVNLSDKMTRLNESGLDLARRTVSAESGEAAIPLDLFSTALPKYWVQTVGDYHRVLLINWEDEPAELSIDLEKAGVAGRKAVNFWNDKPVKIKAGRIAVELAPRSCLFAVVR